MGLTSLEQLRAFCLELSLDKPSPGGGSASAAAGAMAASLLIMVCGITARSKKHSSSRPELEQMIEVLQGERDKLLALALQDALAYDSVAKAIKELKASPASGKAEEQLQSALQSAARVPMNTSAACLRILQLSSKVADLGIRAASSDVAVAAFLAKAGFDGARTNVMVNLKEIKDKGFVSEIGKRLEEMKDTADETAGDAFSR